MNTSLNDMIKYLKSSNRYQLLIDRYSNSPKNQSFWFEIVFAYWMENVNHPLGYEAPTNSVSNSSVDFELIIDNNKYLFELTRIEHSEEIIKYIENQKRDDSLFGQYTLILSSRSSNPFFTTAAQLIRLQEKILEKVRKLPDPEPNIYSFVLCDCSNIHSGMLDEDDVRTALFGKPDNSLNQEFFKSQRLLGMFEKEYCCRRSGDFKKRIAAVILVPELKDDGLGNSIAAINPNFDSKLIFDKITSIKLFKNIRILEQKRTKKGVTPI